MTADARALFRELSDRTPAEREDNYVLHQVPPELRAEVESLLLFDGAAGESLNAYVAAAGDAVLDTDLPPAGRRYGSYRLIRLLGCGGMGAVYEAEQEHP